MSERQVILRKVRSFVRRDGRVSESHQRAMEEHWQDMGLDVSGSVFDFDQVFARRARRHLEIGFGKGDSILAMAEANPDEDFIGIEVYKSGIARVIADAQQGGLSNIRLFNHDAVEVLQQSVADGSLDQVYIFFPDPWHKKRHHKRRLIQTEFLDLLAKKLKAGGKLFVATDWENYAEHMMEVLSMHTLFENAAGKGKWSERAEFRPKTKFEKRGERLGHGVWDGVFVRK